MPFTSLLPWNWFGPSAAPVQRQEMIVEEDRVGHLKQARRLTEELHNGIKRYGLGRNADGTLNNNQVVYKTGLIGAQITAALRYPQRAASSAHDAFRNHLAVANTLLNASAGAGRERQDIVDDLNQALHHLDQAILKEAEIKAWEQRNAPTEQAA